MSILTNYIKLMGISLSCAQIDQLYHYRAILIEWNKNINLTAINDPEEILLNHFLDSISVKRVRFSDLACFTSSRNVIVPPKIF